MGDFTAPFAFLDSKVRITRLKLPSSSACVFQPLLFAGVVACTEENAFCVFRSTVVRWSNTGNTSKSNFDSLLYWVFNQLLVGLFRIMSSSQIFCKPTFNYMVFHPQFRKLGLKVILLVWCIAPYKRWSKKSWHLLLGPSVFFGGVGEKTQSQVEGQQQTWLFNNREKLKYPPRACVF